MILMPLFFQATFPFVSSPFLHLFWRLKQILASWVSLCVTSLWRMISSKVAPKGAITVVSSEDVDHDAASPVLLAGRTLAFAAPLLVETDWKMTPVRSKTVKEKNRVKFGGKWEKCHQSHCCLELPYKNLCKLLYTFRPWTDFMVKCLVTLAQETDEKGAAEPSNPLGFRCWIFFTGAWVVWNGFGFRQGGKKLEGLATWKILEFSSSRTVDSQLLLNSAEWRDGDGIGRWDCRREGYHVALIFLWKDQGLCFRDGMVAWIVKCDTKKGNPAAHMGECKVMDTRGVKFKTVQGQRFNMESANQSINRARASGFQRLDSVRKWAPGSPKRRHSLRVGWGCRWFSTPRYYRIRYLSNYSFIYTFAHII